MICEPCQRAADNPTMIDISGFEDPPGTTMITQTHLCRDLAFQEHGCPCQHRTTQPGTTQRRPNEVLEPAQARHDHNQ